MLCELYRTPPIIHSSAVLAFDFCCDLRFMSNVYNFYASTPYGVAGLLEAVCFLVVGASQTLTRRYPEMC